ncbi:MAG: hypothetical protein QM497_06925 [Sulfurimonas sp.]
MKILSYDISSQSKNVQYKSIVESKLSFGEFIPKSSLEKPPQDVKQIQKPHTLQRLRQNSNLDTSIYAILQRLINSLTQRDKVEAQPKDNITGYLHTSFYEKVQEHESLDFFTKGVIKTDKGDLDIDVNFSMTRSFIVENSIDIYHPFDPLVINLDGEIPQLSSDTFSFDLDNDGENDQISKLKGNSGFLAFDKNDDGIINQGSELFGTLSGNGFGELSTYDLDGNGWIDENDNIFNKLQVWFKNDDTQEKELVGLGESGVGAIFLGATQSEFTYKTESNHTLGEMKSSSIFLNEDFSVGTIAQIDFNAQKQDEPLAELLQA